MAELVPAKIKTRFLERILIADDCWCWSGDKDGGGYGRCPTGRQKKYVLAHRVSFLLYVGIIPPGMEVMHTCDNPGCVKPTHLRVGTHFENMRDMVNKGRSSAYEANPKARLNRHDVLEIKRRLASGESGRSLAARYSVSPQCISDIKSGKCWTPRRDGDSQAG